jgi:hypothetical protein
MAVLRKQGAEGLGLGTHLWIEWELHMGFLPEAELGEVIENCQEMVIWCHYVFITDTQLQHILGEREDASPATTVALTCFQDKGPSLSPSREVGLKDRGYREVPAQAERHL